ncbi:hypothetical protein BUALT_Bualt01G0100600 [Buddleja alternifolia]|uniref:S-acyltransferase n=1 Tax=Buddleja alternifolia TaxID=168488 RepID=A0AAV6YEE7_9LAMI|nr:hypothetical protein BUALT_Bualt01G0100600 [Buddleja alternifolia]
MKLKRFVSIPIVSVFVFLGFSYYVTIFIFIEDWFGLQTSAGVLNSLIFTLLIFLFLFSFSVCVLTDPGEVPASYVPDVEQNQSPDQEFHKRGVYPSRCDKCSAHKPPRAHHCRVCRTCVLRMDHHCVWINNCVGHRNYKSFLVLVFYATVASFYFAIIITICTFNKDWDSIGNRPLKSFYFGCWCTSIGLSLVLGTLLGWNMYLTAHNMTTIEVLGPNMLKWLWPTAVSHIKDGLSFPTARDSSNQ